MEWRGVVAGEHEQGGHPTPIQQPQIKHHACLLTWLRLIGRDAMYIHKYLYRCWTQNYSCTRLPRPNRI